jgi:hypothetical protein
MSSEFVTALMNLVKAVFDVYRIFHRQQGSIPASDGSDVQ